MKIISLMLYYNVQKPGLNFVPVHLKSKCYLDSLAMALIVTPASSLDRDYLSEEWGDRGMWTLQRLLLEEAGIKMMSGDRVVALQHAGLWSRLSPLHWHSGISSTSESLPKRFSGAIEQSLGAFQRPHLILCPLEFYYSFVKGGGTSYLHVMLSNLHVKIVVCP